MELVVKEWETVLDWKEQGRIQEVYGFMDGSGGFIVLEADSREVVKDLVKELPLFPYANWDIKEMMIGEEGLEKAMEKLADSVKG